MHGQQGMAYLVRPFKRPFPGVWLRSARCRKYLLPLGLLLLLRLQWLLRQGRLATA